MKLKRIIEQQGATGQYYDLGKDFFAFVHAINAATETVKVKFEQLISSKLKGKKIRARASRGYKQFEKDYDINVVNVSIDDYYDNYVVVVKSQKGKEYFLKPSFKVQIIGNIEPEAPKEEPKEPEQPGQSHQKSGPEGQPPKAPSQSAPAQSAPAQPEQPQINPQFQKPPLKEMENTIIDYSQDDIKKDISALNGFLTNSSSVENYIKGVGKAVVRNGKKTATFSLVIPVEDVPGLTTEFLESELKRLSSSQNATFSLSKFDVNGDKYLINIKKVEYL